MSTLNTLCQPLEPTDEIVVLNKHYQALDIVYEKLSEVRDLIAELSELDLECANGEIKMLAKKHKFLDRDKALKALDILMHETAQEHSHTAYKAREIFTFQKLGRAITLYKTLKDENKNKKD